MTITPTTLNATTEAIATRLGPTWTSLGADKNGTTYLINETSTGELAITLHPIWQGRTVNLRLAATGPRATPARGPWRVGPIAWNHPVRLTSDDDHAQLIADAITHDLLPAASRKPRFVGDRPWEIHVWNPETRPAEAKEEAAPQRKKAAGAGPRKPRARKAATGRSARASAKNG
ncbi:hypothetical protein [Streptomyces sp. NPDC088925]|uniref:hypothetical protein n=1 Tax=Streptomyces sp. NPDC088925 TaxID=3365914 RepID=UPI0037FAE686